MRSSRTPSTCGKPAQVARDVVDRGALVDDVFLRLVVLQA